MEKGYVICVLLAIIAVVSTTISHGVKSEKVNFIKGIFGFFFCYYFLLSTIKWFLGSAENTLVESFWDAVPRTYLHYGLPLTVIGVVVPVVVKKLFKTVLDKLVGVFDAFILIGLFGMFLVQGVVSNASFCVIFVIAAVAALGITFCYKKEILYVSKSEYKKYILEVLPSVAVFIFMTGIYYSNELYLNNLEEFLNSYGEMFLILLIGSLLSAVVIMIGMLALPKAWIRPCSLALAGISIMGYLQAMFFNGKLSALTGNEQIWEMRTQVINVVIWLVVIGLVIGLGCFWDIFNKVFKGICIYICLIQLVTLVTMMVTTDVSNMGSQAALTTDDALEISNSNNVLVFILDMFDSSVLQEIIAEDDSFVEPLADFTFYQNATSCYSHTKTSIPYLLQAYDGNHALAEIQNQGYQVGIYTNVDYLNEASCDIATNYREKVVVKSDIVNTYATMRQTAMYSLAPFCLKQNYVYYTSDIMEMIDADEIWSIENDLLFYNNLMETGLSVNEEYTNAFKFYHMRGAHEPFYLSEDLQYDKTGRENTVYSQARGSLKIVYEYLNQLKALGKYEDATIIITADHGKIINYDVENHRPDEPSMPIMLVKEPGQSKDSLFVSDAPVSQTEIMPLIMKQIGLDWKEYGRTFDEIAVNEDRQRFYNAATLNGYEFQFSIDGDANDLESWSVKE